VSRSPNASPACIFYCNICAVAARRRLRPLRKRILIVDDGEDNRRIYTMFLTAAGFDVQSASDGHEALAKVRGLLPDVVVMDFAIPGIDGWQVTRRLKRDPRTRRIPVIALTGHALAGAEQRARQAGCELFLTKPCLPEDLQQHIERVMAGSATKRRADTR
jgi:two-component system cell cycle response regulator DivK